MLTPAQKLLGMKLDGGWTVVKKIVPPSEATGGSFSTGYIVHSTSGAKGYLKALDYSRALRAPDPARELQSMTAAFNFERDLLNKCRSSRLDRVVICLDDGTVSVDPANPAGVVQYLIFELADGDVRTRMSAADRLDIAWALRSLHHVATGLFQLHGQGIAHQDLKPSNVLVFGRDHSKIGDLGRCAYAGHQPPHESLPVAGDPTYAPPELLYRYISADWGQRRFGCDAYLLGSMVVFLFTGLGTTSILLSHLHPSQHYRQWAGTFNEVLPFLRNSFAQTIEEVARSVDPLYRDDLSQIVRHLCDPDPNIRGHPHNRGSKGNPYSLERYVSWFNLLAAKAEAGLATGRT